MNVLDRISRTPYPRLTLLIIGGFALIILGGALAVAGSLVDLDFDVLSFRIGIIGYLLLTFGAAGYIALTVFKRHPEP